MANRAIPRYIRVVSCLRDLCFLIVLLIAVRADAVVGLTRDELSHVYGPVQEESRSVYGPEFTDLLFTSKLKTGEVLIVAATMMNGRCQAISYLKHDAAGKPAPLTNEEVTSQMSASAQHSGGVWKQLSPHEWQLDPGPDVPGGLRAQWIKPELFQLFSHSLLEQVSKKK